MSLLKDKLALLPASPGAYLMKNEAGRVIYVGKAKVLKNRVRSYFTGSHDSKTEKMISEIADFEFIVTQSEVEALLLEYNLIKKYQPPYNIMLRDDKSYPYILVTAEKHPRIMVTRKLQRPDDSARPASPARARSGRYFGPYPSASAAREAARLLNRLFPLRKCRRLPKQACLYAHIGQCLAPCVNEVSADAYRDIQEKLNHFFRGNQKEVVRWLEAKMQTASEEKAFETAAGYRDLLDALRLLREKQAVSFSDYKIRDIVGYAVGEELLSVQIFYFRSGQLSSRDSFLLPYYGDPEEAFLSFLLQRYVDSPALPDEICAPVLSSGLICELLPVVMPKRGRLRELVALAQQNATTQLEQKVSLEKRVNQEAVQAQDTLVSLLNLPALHIIEAFDISNFRAAQMVCGMVQFAEGNPMRSNYRKFTIKDLDHPDDRAAIRQVVGRRYRRLLAEESPLPDLVLVDGGFSQVKAATEALADLGLSLPVAGMVKDDRHRTRALLTLAQGELDLSAEAFHLIERIQEEVHRFAITFHRQKRQHDFLTSQLDAVPGIGRKRRLLLLQHFRNLERIKHASAADLQAVGLPSAVAETLYAHFHAADLEGRL